MFDFFNVVVWARVGCESGWVESLYELCITSLCQRVAYNAVSHLPLANGVLAAAILH
jgi:hypothetical protein